MAVHTSAFYYGNQLALAELPTLVDQVLTQSGTGGLVAPRPLQIIGVYVGGADSAQVVAPTLAQVTAPWIRPLETAAAPASSPALASLAEHPLPLPAGESVRLKANRGSAGVVAGLLFFADRVELPPAGPRYIVKGSAANTAVVPAAPAAYLASWSPLPVAWNEQLPAGRYKIVCFEFIAGAAGTGTAAPIAARLVLAGQTFRPGTLAFPMVGGKYQNSRYLYDSAFGVLGEFESFAMPSVEVLENGNAASTYDFTVYMHVVRVADAAGKPCGCNGGRG